MLRLLVNERKLKHFCSVKRFSRQKSGCFCSDSILPAQKIAVLSRARAPGTRLRAPVASCGPGPESRVLSAARKPRRDQPPGSRESNVGKRRLSASGFRRPTTTKGRIDETTKRGRSRRAASPCSAPGPPPLVGRAVPGEPATGIPAESGRLCVAHSGRERRQKPTTNRRKDEPTKRGKATEWA